MPQRDLPPTSGTLWALLYFGLALLGSIAFGAPMVGSAWAQQADADVLVARAIVAYGEKRYEDALAALRQALEVDPNNADALYYTGLVYIAQGRPEEAAEVLEKSRARSPKDEATLFQLGVVYFSQGKYDQAQPLLEQVFATNPRLDSLGYYVGFMRYRNKDYQGALAAFRAGVSTDPNIQQLTRFYTGLAFGILGLPERATSEISEALRLQPASPLTGPAERLRETIATRREEEKRLGLEVRLGGFYDDNVSVIPQSSPDPLVQALRTQKHTSPGWLGSLRANYSFVRTGPWEATATGSVFTTQDNDINRLSIVDYLGGLGGTYRGALETSLGVLPFQASLQYTYDLLTLGGDEFVTRHTVTPLFTLIEGQHNLTSFQFQYQHKRYALSPNPIQGEKRDGSNYMAGFLHILRFEGDKHLLKVGYQADWDLIQGGDFTYFGNRVLAGGQYTFPFGKPLANLRLTYDFDVHLRDYRNFNVILPILSPNIKARFETEYNHHVGLIYPLTGNVQFLETAKMPGVLYLSADFQATVAKSRLEVFTYNRNFASLSIIWAY